MRPHPRRLVAAAAAAAAAGALLPATAQAAAPEVFTSFSASLSPTQARVVGEVTPGGEATTYRAVYDTAESPWCAAETGAPSFTSGALEPLASTTEVEVVDVTVDGLTPGSEYCIALEAVNASAPDGVRSSPPEPLRAGAPETVGSDALGGTSPTTARLAVDVWPAGQVTTVAFRWAPSSSTFCVSDGTESGGETAVAPQTVGPANAWTTASADIAGLSPGQTYCFVSTVENASIAGDPLEEFWTLTTSRSAATTGAAVDVAATRATLTGTVNPGGIDTSASFEYASASSAWCSTGGVTGDADHETHPLPAGAEAADVPVQAVVTELAPQTAYCFRVVARTAEGIVTGATVPFTTGAVQAPAPPAPAPTIPWADPPASVLPKLGRIWINTRDAGRRIERVRGAVAVGAAGTRLTVEVLTAGPVRGIRGSANRRVRIGRSSRTVRKAGITGFTVRLTSAARRALRSKGTARVIVRITVGSGTAKATRSLRVVLRRTQGTPIACRAAAPRAAGAARCMR